MRTAYWRKLSASPLALLSQRSLDVAALTYRDEDLTTLVLSLNERTEGVMRRAVEFGGRALGMTRHGMNIGELTGIGAILFASLSVTAAAQAGQVAVWNYVPGVVGNHIAVNSFNGVYVSTNDGYVYEGSSTCTPDPRTGLCLPYTKWKDTGARNVSKLASDLSGMVGATTTDNKVCVRNVYVQGQSQSWNCQSGFVAPAGGAACLGSFAMSATSVTTLLYYNAFYVQRMWATDCASSSLWQDNTSLYVFYSNALQFTYGSKQWNLLDTGGGDHGVALFSATGGGSLEQRPWFLSRYNLAYAWVGDQVVEAGAPLSKHTKITYMTDHYVIASGSVYKWNGDVTGHGTGNSAKDWTLIVGSPPGAALAEIAFAPAFDGHSLGLTSSYPGSDLWGLDVYGNVYTLGYADDTVVK